MSGQSWHNFLATNLSTISEKKDTKVAKHRQQILDRLTPSSGLFPDVKTQNTTGELITWQGKKYIPGVLPADHIIREILWELYQLNFYYELLSLDRHACTNLTTSDNLQLMHRQALISKCFSIDPFMTTSLPTHNCGLAGQEIEECLPFVLALVRVMQSWKGDKPPVFQLVDRSFREISATDCKSCNRARGGCHEVLLPAILQLFRMRGSSSSPPLSNTHQFRQVHVAILSADLFFSFKLY